MEEACLNLANHLISLCQAPLPQTCSLNEIDSDFFTLIFEKICHMPLPDLLAYPKNFEEKAHNVQVVIDTLSLDLLAISLSHITGEDVVARNVHSIYNLLEVMEGVVLFNPIATAMEDVHWERENAEQLQTVRPYTQQSFSAIDVKSTAMNADVEGCNCCGYHYRANTEKMATEKYLLLKHISDDENIQADMPCIKSDYGTKSTSVHLESDKKELELENERQNQPLEPQIRIKYHSDSSNFQSGQVTYDYLEKGLIQEDAIDECIIKVPINRSSKNRSRVTINESSSSRTPQASRKTEKNDNSDKLSRLKLIPKKAIKAKYEKNMRILIPGTKKMNVADLHRKNLEMKLENFPEICHKQNRVASQLEKTYLQAITNKSRKLPTCKKSYLLPVYLRRSQSHAICNKCLTKPATSQKNKGKKREMSIETAFLKELKDEFSGVYMSSGTGKKMKDKYQKQLLTMHQTVKDIIQKKSRTQLQTEEVVKKQKILSDILKRQIEHQKYVKEQNEHKHLHTVVQASFREARHQSARTRNYYNEYHNEMKKKMQKRNYSEEALLKNAFEECLDLQKEQIHLLCQQAKEHQERDALHHKIYLDALDNYYQSQFSLLAESLAIENHDLEEKTKSQRQVLSKLKQNFRSQMIRNIRNLQENLSRDKEETHFRELDAERYKDRLCDAFSVHLSKNHI